MSQVVEDAVNELIRIFTHRVAALQTVESEPSDSTCKSGPVKAYNVKICQSLTGLARQQIKILEMR